MGFLREMIFVCFFCDVGFRCTYQCFPLFYFLGYCCVPRRSSSKKHIMMRDGSATSESVMRNWVSYRVILFRFANPVTSRSLGALLAPGLRSASPNIRLFSQSTLDKCTRLTLPATILLAPESPNPHLRIPLPLLAARPSSHSPTHAADRSLLASQHPINIFPSPRQHLHPVPSTSRFRFASVSRLPIRPRHAF